MIKKFSNSLFAVSSFPVFLLILFCVLSTSHQALASPCDDFDQALQKASEIRGLKILKPVKCSLISKENFARLMQKTYAKYLTNEKLLLEERASKMTGLIPESYDYAECYFASSLESVMASYFPEHKTVYIPENSQSSFDLLVHEATHALQDQHFKLWKLSKQSSYSTDASFAFSALAEGDAEIVQLKFLNTSEPPQKRPYIEGSPPGVNKCELPQALLFQLDFPYFWGARYVRTLESINKTFSKHPKHSTEILYPGKNFNYKEPTNNDTFKLAQSVSKNLNPKPVYKDSWGEYTLRCLLRELVGSKASVIAAYGWLGDKITLYQIKDKKDQHVLSWIINMRNQADSIELFTALKGSIQKRFNIDINSKGDTVIFGNDIYSKIMIRYQETRVEFVVSNEKILTTKILTENNNKK